MSDQIRIYAKKAYEFKNADGDTFSCPHSYIGPAPAWVKSDDLFKLAQKSGNIEEITTREDEKRAEGGGSDPELDSLRVHGKALGIQRVSQLGKDKLIAAIAEKLGAMDLAALTEYAGKSSIDISELTTEDEIRACVKESMPKG